MSLTKQLRDAIKGSDLSLYRIAKETGMDYSVLYRFAEGQRDIHLGNAEKLSEFFGMKLTRPRKRRREE